MKLISTFCCFVILTIATSTSLKSFYYSNEISSITNCAYSLDFKPIKFIDIFKIQDNNKISDSDVNNTENPENNDEVIKGSKYKDYVNIIIITFSLVIIFLVYKRKKEYKEQNKIITKQNEMLRDLNTTKDKFFSIIAHDLKNPISSFHQLSEALSENYEMFTKEDKEEFFEELKTSSKSLYNLLDTLLAWSNSQRGKIPFSKEENDVKFIVDSTLAPLSVHALNKKIKLINKIPENIIATFDSNMISTIVRNLVSNSIKFSHENTSIIIDYEIKDGNIIISIKDEGVGMSQKIIDKLFKIEESVSSVGTSGEKGTGLGLILCKEFIDNHKGEIWAESEIGKGSTFKFEFPVK